MSTTPRTLAQLAQEALDVQDACNLSGVALGFGRAMADLRRVLDTGSDSIRTHAVTVLWMDKLNDMTHRVDAYGIGDTFSAAYDTCKTLAANRATEGANAA